MKNRSLTNVALALTLFLSATFAYGQRAKQGPDVNRDPDMEKESLHHLEAARFYFSNLRKAYVASLQRCEEVLAGNPTFSRIDEVLFIAGKSSLNLADAKGKQKPAEYVIREGDKKTTLTSQDFRDKARDYLSQLVNEHPDSSFRARAEEDLKALGGLKPKESKP